MAIMNFPENPSVGDIYTFEGYRYRWSGVKWQSNWVRSDTSLDLFKSELASEGSTVLVGGAVAGDFGDTVKTVNDAKDAGVFTSPILSSPVLSGIAHDTTMLSHRNLLINGDFRIWQRYTGVDLPSGGYTADRWRLTTTAGAPTDVACNRYAFPAEHLFGVSGFKYAYNWYHHTTSERAYISQRIEGVNTASGKMVTLSFYAQALGAANATSVSVGINRTYGAGGSPSDSMGGGRISISGPARYSITFQIPILTNDKIWNRDATDHFLEVWIQRDQAYAGTIYITGIQLELGEVATPFEHRPYGYELSLCRRYYLESQQTYSNGVWSTLHHLGMRVAPSVSSTILSDGGGNLIYNDVVADSRSIRLDGNSNGAAAIKFKFDAEL